jgi:hypothetical protein
LDADPALAFGVVGAGRAKPVAGARVEPRVVDGSTVVGDARVDIDGTVGRTPVLARDTSAVARHHA